MSAPNGNKNLLLSDFYEPKKSKIKKSMYIPILFLPAISISGILILLYMSITSNNFLVIIITVIALIGFSILNSIYFLYLYRHYTWEVKLKPAIFKHGIALGPETTMDYILKRVKPLLFEDIVATLIISDYIPPETYHKVRKEIPNMLKGMTPTSNNPIQRICPNYLIYLVPTTKRERKMHEWPFFVGCYVKKPRALMSILSKKTKVISADSEKIIVNKLE